MIPISLKSIVMTALLLLQIRATLRDPVEKISCSKNISFPQVFSVNHSYEGQPYSHQNQEACSALAYSCCTENEFSDLVHYWTNINDSQNFSFDSKQYFDLTYKILFQYKETWRNKALRIQRSGNVTPELQKHLDAILKDTSKPDDHAVKETLKSFRDDLSKCGNFNASLIKGMMCGMCSPETYHRVIKNRIWFDRLEAAQFGKNCEGWLVHSHQIAEKFDSVANIMAHTDKGTRTGHEIPLFRFFWDSDPDYTPAAMHKNFSNCKLVSNEINLDSVKPEIGCRTVVEKYMSIGSLVIFDEKTYNGLIKLWAMVKEEYALAITNSDSMDINSEKRILAGDSGDTVTPHPQPIKIDLDKQCLLEANGRIRTAAMEERERIQKHVPLQ